MDIKPKVKCSRCGEHRKFFRLTAGGYLIAGTQWWWQPWILDEKEGYICPGCIYKEESE